MYNYLTIQNIHAIVLKTSKKEENEKNRFNQNNTDIFNCGFGKNFDI